MPSYKPYRPDQAELLPRHAQGWDEKTHPCFLVHGLVEELEIRKDIFRQLLNADC